MEKELPKTLFEMLLTHIKVRTFIKTLATKMTLPQCTLSTHRSEQLMEKWIKKTTDRRFIKSFLKLWRNLNCHVLCNNSYHCCHLNVCVYLNKEHVSYHKVHFIFYSSFFSCPYLSTTRGGRLICLFPLVGEIQSSCGL